jgi:hypothetical protein
MKVRKAGVSMPARYLKARFSWQARWSLRELKMPTVKPYRITFSMRRGW